MKILKTVLAVLAVAVVILFAGQNSLYSVGGEPNPWAVNAGATGERATGPLTMYGQEIPPASPPPGPPPQPTCGEFDTEIQLNFFLRLKIGNTLHIFSGVSEGTQCHPNDYAGAETVALHEFLKEVLVELRPGGGYEGCTPDPFGEAPPGTDVCPNILRSMDNVLDTEGQAGPLSLIADVELRIPR